MQTNVQFTLRQAFSFDMPTVSVIHNSSNGPTDGGDTRITVLGSNFGAYSLSAAQSIRVGLSTCEVTVWTSDSVIACGLPPGVASFLSIEVTAGLQYNSSQYLGPRRASAADFFSYDAGLLSRLAAANGPTATSDLVLTASGRNFGAYDYSLMTRTGLTAAEHTIWFSDSVIWLKVAAGNRDGLAVFATVGGLNLTQGAPGLVGTSLSVFTYDSATASSSSRANLAPSSVPALLPGVNLTGANFGASDLSAAARLGFSSCLSSQWIRDDAVTCMVPPGVGGSLAVRVTVDVVVGSGLETILSYDAPFLGNSSSAANYAPASGLGVVWEAVNLGERITFGSRGTLVLRIN